MTPFNRLYDQIDSQYFETCSMTLRESVLIILPTEIPMSRVITGTIK